MNMNQGRHARVRLSRRQFMGSTLAGASWLLGTHGQAQPASAAPPPAPVGFSPWLRLEPDGQVIAYTGTSDIGQGTWATLRFLVAEQLEVPPDLVRVEAAPVVDTYLNPFTRNYATFGSIGLLSGFVTLGRGAAAAREMLQTAAASRWQVPVAECTSRDGAVWHQATQRSLPYGDLLAAAAALPAPQRPTLKPRAQWRLLGKEIPPSPDLARRSSGAFRYGLDAVPKGALRAVVLPAPTFGGRLLNVQEGPAMAVAGVVKVVRLETAVAVVARDTATALRALATLKPSWRAGPFADVSAEARRKALLDATMAGAGKQVVEERAPQLDSVKAMAALAAAAQVVDITFDVPFLAHMPMEPLNACVQVDPDRAQVWLSTQSPLDTQVAVGKALGLTKQQVTLHLQPAGGGFGRRLEHDFAVVAARIAQALPGQAVSTLWTREAELRSGYFRPEAAARVRLALAADGMPTAVRADLANPSLLEYSGLTNSPANGHDWTATMGWLNQPYAIPAMDLRWTRVDHGVPCGYWRSVGASQNHFFFECALDVAAARSGQDPLALRQRLLRGDPRASAFLDKLASAAGWSTTPPKGHFRGIAISSANGCLSGHVVELKLSRPGQFKIVAIVAAIDAGVVVDPRAVEAQMTGGTILGLSAALSGEITVDRGAVKQRNFDSYRVVSMRDLPPLKVLTISGTERPAGVGEEGVATIGPAIANALLAATGKPVTRLPLTRAGWVMA